VRPALVRFRILDPGLRVFGVSDLTVPVAELASLDLPVKRVFVTENEVNGLAFPDVPASIVVFGLGYSVDRLAAVPWLSRRQASFFHAAVRSAPPLNRRSSSSRMSVA
jgi:hypothetical protein